MNKKGNLLDTPFLTVGLIVLFLIILIGGGVLYSLVDAMVSSSLINVNNITNEKIVPVRDKYFGWTDFIFVMSFFGFWFLIYIGAFFIRSNPIFLGFAVLLSIINIIIAAVLSNLAGVIANKMFCSTCVFSALPDITTQLPMTLFIVEKLPFFILPMSALLIIILYAKRES